MDRRFVRRVLIRSEDETGMLTLLPAGADLFQSFLEKLSIFATQRGAFEAKHTVSFDLVCHSFKEVGGLNDGCRKGSVSIR